MEGAEGVGIAVFQNIDDGSDLFFHRKTSQFSCRERRPRRSAAAGGSMVFFEISLAQNAEKGNSGIRFIYKNRACPR
jgi:hypothetical protein